MTKVEVAPGLWVGDQGDWDALAPQLGDTWAVVHACKEPHHRAALGYTTLGAPKDHPEYLYAMRNHGRELCLNMVDAAEPKYFAPAMVNVALDFITLRLGQGKRVLVHCNQGESRGPSLALLWLRRAVVGGWADTGAPVDLKWMAPAEALEWFRQVYPAFNPKLGIWGYLEQHWEDRDEQGDEQGSQERNQQEQGGWSGPTFVPVEPDGGAAGAEEYPQPAVT